MIEKEPKFPMFFIFMLMALSILMMVGVFFNSAFVGVLFFIGLLLVIVFTILDKKYGMRLACHDDYYLFVDIVCAIAVASIIYYEEANQSNILKIFLGILFGSILLLIILDVFFCRDKYFVKKECLFIDIAQICSMICILAYFYGVSEFWFAVVALCICVTNFVVRVVITLKQKKNLEKIDEKNSSIENDGKTSIEEIIHSNTEQGDME